jgi:hypothetical protein
MGCEQPDSQDYPTARLSACPPQIGTRGMRLAFQVPKVATSAITKKVM